MDINLLLCIICSISLTVAEVDWTNQCNNCSCTWMHGKKTANCANQNLIEIPKDLNSSIQDIDFSNNELYSLNSYELLQSKLQNVNKLKFQNCSMEHLSESAFFGLSLLTELDLSRNRISVLSKNVFRHNVQLRILVLSYNSIDVLEDEIFHNLTSLLIISIDNNQIKTISPDTLSNLPSVTHINLSYNKISQISINLKKNLPKLNRLNLEGNPWICDCHLQEFREFTIKNNLIEAKIDCYEPPLLKGRTWNDDIIFACKPEIVDPKSSTRINAVYPNITITCKIKGKPIPKVEWVLNGHVIENGTENNQDKYSTSVNVTDNYIWSVLNIMNLDFRDAGDYNCIATNAGGEDKRSITLIIPPVQSSEAEDRRGEAGFFVTLNVYWFIGFCVGLVFIILIVILTVLMFLRYFRRKPKVLNANTDNEIDTDEEYINMHVINPIAKPARSAIPPSVDSGDTDLTDIKRNFPEDELIFDVYGEPPENTFDHLPHYPFDNTSDFPRARPRSIESPVSSFASTTPLLRPRDPQNQFHDPTYDQFNPYRTLPALNRYDPLTAYQPRIPKQGYVTIPRRPRLQNWNPAPLRVASMETDL